MNDRLTRMLAGEPTEDLQRNIKQYIEERYEVVKRLEWLNRELDTLMRELDRREVLAQKPPATEKTVKLKTRSADGLYWEVLYTDGTWAGEEVSHE